MARIAKSLVAPEQGYAHREHRSVKGREENRPFNKFTRKKLQRIKDRRNDIPLGMTNRKAKRKGKWIV